MKKIILKTAVGLGIFALTLSSCQKLGGYETSTLMGEDEAAIEISEQQIDADADMASLRTSCEPKDFGGCATITESFPEGGEYPKIITVDFGPDGCNNRKGKIIISISNNMHVTGANRTVTFVDFYHGNKQIEGSRSITNTGVNESGNIVFDVNHDISITGERGTHIRTRTGQKEWIAGSETEDCMDDEFLLTGSSTGTGCKGKSISKTIQFPVHVARSCKYPLSGTVEIKGDKLERTIDFGAGKCDNVATVSGDKGTKVINLDEVQKNKKGRKRR